MPETCHSDPNKDKLWKDALKCGYYHAYGVFQASGKGLQAVFNQLDDNDWAFLACASSRMFFKMGAGLCYNYHITAYALFLASEAKGISLTNQELNNYAEAAIQKNSPTFVASRDCA